MTKNKTIHTPKYKHIVGSKAEFVFSAHPDEVFPEESKPEIAFVGRSNVGKSSLINGFLGRHKLARTSNTPGATRSIHFYDIQDFLLVDLPGYGYAKLSKTQSAQINAWVSEYFASRRTLKLVCVLVDCRHGLKESDRAMLQTLVELGVRSQVVLTKFDKTKAVDFNKIKKQIQKDLESIVGTNPNYVLTSSEKRFGMEELEETIYNML